MLSANYASDFLNGQFIGAIENLKQHKILKDKKNTNTW